MRIIVLLWTLAGRFVQWKMTIKGIPVEQAATVAFEAALAEAISAETGNYTSDNATVLVRRRSLLQFQ